MQNNKFCLKEILRFLIGGGSAVITDYLLYTFLTSSNFDIFVSKAISFIAGSIVGFIINKFWTFNSKKLLLCEILKYAVLYFFTAIINSAVNKAAFIVLDVKLLAFFAATGTSTVLNFLGQKFFVFIKEIEN